MTNTILQGPELEALVRQVYSKCNLESFLFELSREMRRGMTHSNLSERRAQHIYNAAVAMQDDLKARRGGESI